MTRPQDRCFVVMNLPVRVPDLVVWARAVVAALQDNAALPSPTPSVATLGAAIDALEEAQTATLSRTLGTVATRDAALTALRSALRRYQAYVQEQADARPEQAVALVEGSGLSVRRPKSRSKKPFSAKAGATSGSVVLEARATSKRASYTWAWSGDGGATWTAVPATLSAKTTLTGLPTAKTLTFRYRAVTKDGDGDWSEPLAFVVQ